jgi:hypothetical protein
MIRLAARKVRMVSESMKFASSESEKFAVGEREK